MENKENKNFSSRDIYLASTLITLKYEMVNVSYQVEGERRNPIGYFEFEKTEELENTVNDFWQGKVRVDPREFMTNMWGLKSMVTNVYKNPNSEIGKKLQSGS